MKLNFSFEVQPVSIFVFSISHYWNQGWRDCSLFFPAHLLVSGLALRLLTTNPPQRKRSKNPSNLLCKIRKVISFLVQVLVYYVFLEQQFDWKRRNNKRKLWPSIYEVLLRSFVMSQNGDNSPLLIMDKLLPYWPSVSHVKLVWLLLVIFVLVTCPKNSLISVYNNVPPRWIFQAQSWDATLLKV